MQVLYEEKLGRLFAQPVQSWKSSAQRIIHSYLTFLCDAKLHWEKYSTALIKARSFFLLC